MPISDSYTFLSAILLNNTNITSKVSVFKDTSIPLIQGGVLAETETNLPAITFNVDDNTRTYFLDEQFYIIGCHAENQRDCYLLAKTIIDEFNQCDIGFDGFSAKITCRLLGGTPDPQARQITIPVEFRIVNI